MMVAITNHLFLKLQTRKNLKTKSLMPHKMYYHYTYIHGSEHKHTRRESVHEEPFSFAMTKLFNFILEEVAASFLKTLFSSL
jgi:hypothetical protein